MRLLHLSDLHFQADVAPRWPLDLRQRCARAEFVWQGRPALFRDAPKTVGKLLTEATAAGVEHVLVTGDLTAIALREEFLAARDALAPYAGRLTVIPGNHDRISRGSAPFFEEVFAAPLQSALPDLCADALFPVVHLVGRGLAIVGLDSGRVPLVPGLAQGRVGQRQLDALARILVHPQLAGRAVVVAVHHAPFRPDGRRDKWSHGLTDAARLLEIVDRHGVAALCHGHIHRRYQTRRQGKTPIFGAGSSTQRGREGLIQLEIDGGGLHGALLQTVEGPESATSRQPSRADR